MQKESNMAEMIKLHGTQQPNCSALLLPLPAALPAARVP